MPAYMPQPQAQQQFQGVPGTVVADPWDTELETLIAELSEMQRAREQAGAAPEQAGVAMPIGMEAMPMQRNALAGSMAPEMGQTGYAPSGPEMDGNALAFDPDPRVNPYVSGRRPLGIREPSRPEWIRTDPLAEEQRLQQGRQDLLDMSGYTMAKQGLGNALEGATTGDPLRMAGGIGQVGLAALPYGGRYAGKAISAAMSGPWWRAPAVVGGTALATGPGAEGVLSEHLSSFFGSPAEAQTRLPRKQRQEVEAERQRAENAARIERENREAAARLSVETEASRIRATETAKRETEKVRIQAEEEQRQKDANTPTREKYADYMSYGVPAIVGAATLAGTATRGLSTRFFNNQLTEINKRWKNALGRADRARSAVVRERALSEAEGLQTQFEALRAKGPGGKIAAPVAGLTVGEMGIFAPEEIDLYKAPAGSELQRRTLQPFEDDPWLLAKRATMGAGMGLGPSKIAGDIVTRGYTSPLVGYSAETAAARNALAPRVAPQGQNQQQIPALTNQLSQPAATQAAPATATQTAGTASPNPLSAWEEAQRILREQGAGQAAGSTPRVVGRGTDSRGRVYFYDPATGRRVAPPRSQP